MRFVLLERLRLYTTRLINNLFGPFMWNIMRANRDFNFEPRVKVIAQNLNHTPLWWTSTLGKIRDLGADYLAVLSPSVATRGNDNLVSDSGVFRHHETKTGFRLVSPNNALPLTFQNFDDFAFGTTPPIHTCNHGEHFIAVEDLIHLPGR